jgi:hypothetical protein
MHVTHICLLLLGVTSVPVVSGCAPLPQRATDPEEIRSVEHQRLRALVDFDPAVASALHADDFQLITPEGSEFTKDSYLGNLKSGRLDYRAWEPKEIKVRIYGDAAVIRYDDARYEVAFDGQVVRTGLARHINLYEKRDGRWQVVWSQASGGQAPQPQ